MLKILSLGIVCSLVSILLKRTAKEYVIFVQLGFAVIAGIYIINQSSQLADRMVTYFEMSGNISELCSVMLKGAFVCIASKISCDICIESGNLLISDLIELAGKIILLTLSLPLIEDIIKIAVSFVT